MKTVSKTLIVLGIIVFALGVVFSLQSKSVVGPTSSFMYDNPEWTVNGSIVIASGLVMVALGGLAVLLAKKKRIG
jgi:hypothetical protein